jgi:hypothetical protein
MQPSYTASSRDRIIGWVLLAIGIIGILLAVNHGFVLHKTRYNYSYGYMVGGIIINSLIPLIFVTSGRYYLTGKNAERLAKKANKK